MTPREHITNWLPHVLLLLLLACAIWLLASVLAPLRDPLLLAMAIAAMTYPVIYKPIEAHFGHFFPKVNPTIRKQICGPIGAIALVFIVLSPLFLIMISAIPSLSEAFWVLIGIAKQDPDAINTFANIIKHQAESIQALYHKLPIDPDLVHTEVTAFLTHDFNVVFMDFLNKGSSTLAELILAIVSLAFFYAHGPRLVHVFLDYTPLSPTQQNEMAQHHFQVIARLLNDTIGTAVAKGITLGLIAWLLTGTSFLLVAILAGFMSLLPIVGLTMVWLPLAALSWSHGNFLTAIGIAVLSLGCNYGIDWVRNHVGRKIHDRDAWTGFLLFLGLVGGIISFGAKGFVVGPMVVVITSVLGRFWLPMYGFPTDTTQFERQKSTPTD